MVFFWFFWTKLGNIQVKGCIPSVQEVQQPFLRILNILYEYPFSGSQCFFSAFKWKGIWDFIFSDSTLREIFANRDPFPVWYTSRGLLPHKVCTKSLSSSLPALTPATAQQPALYLVSSRHSVLKTKKKKKCTWFETFSVSLLTLFTCHFLSSSRPILAMFCQAFISSILPQAAQLLE